MKKAVPMIVSEENFKEIFAFADQYSQLAKALYNAALFRIRQVFTGWDKGENRTPLEQSVFDEIQCAKCSLSIKGWKRLSVEITEDREKQNSSFLSERHFEPSGDCI